MSGRNVCAASWGIARDGRSAPRRIQLPDKLAVHCPAGTRAAEFDGMTAADWLRRALDAARKQRERAAR